MSQFRDRVVIITGAGSGVGRAAARLFAEQGARLIITDVRSEWAEATAAEVREAGGEAAWLVCDVSRATDLDAAVSEAVAQFGRLDVMYNNAGVASSIVGRGKAFVDYSGPDVDLLLSINLLGVIHGCQAAARRFIEQGDGGVIVNTSSVAGLVGWGGAVYGATKGAVNQLTKSLAIELAPQGIRVNAVCPAGMITNFGRTDGQRTAAASAEVIATYGRMHPLGRPIEAEDAARAAVFLASDAAANITGVLLPVDGGYTAA